MFGFDYGVIVRQKPSEALAAHVNDVADICAREHLTNIRVFGSVARGEDTAESDIDLLYDSLPDASGFSVATVYNELVELLGCEIDLVSAKHVPPYRRNMMIESIPIQYFPYCDMMV